MLRPRKENDIWHSAITGTWLFGSDVRLLKVSGKFFCVSAKDFFIVIFLNGTKLD